jgi:peptidoglycan/xylan/chitin deacetylase (PgdA/CDA1 family)
MRLRLRSFVKNCWVFVLFGSGALWWAKRQLASRGAVTVLTFHRVLDDREYARSSSLPGILVRERTFDGLLALLAREYEIVDLGCGAPDWSPRLTRPRVAITFDDGWLDNLRYAFPIAARHHASLTIFVCSGLTGRRFPFWPEQALRSLREPAALEQAKNLFPQLVDRSIEDFRESLVERLKQTDPAQRGEYLNILQRAAGIDTQTDDSEPCNQVVTGDQIRELHRNGVRIGSHTVNHPILTQIDSGDAASELEESRKQLEQDLRSKCVSVAYPNGNHNSEIRRVARETGYCFGFTTESGAWTPDSDLLQIPRINIHEQKLVGPRGRFWRAMFEYSVFWRAGSESVGGH